MEDRIVIKPVKNRKAHFTTAKSKIQYLNEDGSLKREMNADRDRYPKTVTITRPEWSRSRNRWNISLSAEELQELVKRSKLTYESGSKKGQLIEEADIMDPRDPFFNHKNLRLIGNEGQMALLKDVPMHQILANSLENNRRFGRNSEGVTAGNKRFIISDEEKDREFEFKKANTELEAMGKLSNMIHDKRLAIGLALGFNFGTKPDPDSIQIALMEYIKSNKRDEFGLFNRDKFLQLAGEDNELINIKSLIGKAKNASVLRYTKAEGFFYSGTKVADDEKAMIEFLKNPSNKEVFERILEAVNEKTK